jgi:tRNA threonylcarbamoyladenosine biosynthesis protein TsaB
MKTIFAAMQILAFETSGKSGSVAAAEDSRPLFILQLTAKQQSARFLAAAIESVLKQVHWRPRDIELIALTVGPGSFTGLRIGVATAKVLAYATGAQVFGVNTLDVIAVQAATQRAKLAIALDAQRSQVVAANFFRDEHGVLQSSSESRLLDNNEWLASLDADTAVSGPALEMLQPRLPAHVTAVDPAQWSPRAETVATLAFERYHAGQRQDLWSLAPVYIRKSAAEEKLEQR